MTFWLAATALTLLASLAVLLPFARRTPGAADDAARDRAHDLAVYRDQLAEVDRDLERGAIRAPEAEQARAEIGRRIVRLGDAAEAVTPAQAKSWRWASMAAVLTVPLVSWGAYGLLGSPDLPSQPLASRLTADPSKAPPEELVARTETYLALHPEDGNGWDVLAPVYVRTGRFADAATAYRNAIRLQGGSVERHVSLGRVLMILGRGVMSPEAKEQFDLALKIDPKDGSARFFAALAKAQGGDIAGATVDWKAMVADLPQGSEWRQAAERAVAEASAPPPAGPSAQEVEAAQSMSADDQTAMISGMVANLDEKLRANPNDPDGWIRLLRSYMVLGKNAEAKDALTRAIAALGADSAPGKRVVEFAASIGLTPAGTP